MVGALFETNPKYDVLTSLLGKEIHNIKYSSNVNIIVDLKSIYRKAYRMDPTLMSGNQKLLIEDITSHIINMIGHYRNFFYKEGKYSTFYILYSTKECEALKEVYPNYKKHYYYKYFNNVDAELTNINNVMKSVTKQIKIMCKYIPHVKFIDTYLLDEFIYANYLVRNKLPFNDINILLSTDPVMYQILDKNTFALDLKGNDSELISEDNVIKYLTEYDNVNFSGNLLNLLLSFTGNDLYSIDNINGYGYKKAYKVINKIFEEKNIIDKTYMTCPESSIIGNKIALENIDTIKKNYRVLFPIEEQIQNESVLSNAFVIYNIDTTLKQFNELNTKIFLLYPINIQSLLKGEDIK